VPFTRFNHPVDWTVRVLADPAFGLGTATTELASAFPMAIAGTAAGPADQGELDASGTHSVTGQLVDLKGKIAVIVIEAAPAAFYSDAVRQATQLLANAGAVGLLAIYNLPGNMQLMLGACPGTLVCFTLGGEDGSFIRALLERAAAGGTMNTLKAELRVTRQPATALQARVLMVKIPGREPGENIVVSAHSDAYFEGANDNASGVAALIALAKHYAHGPKPRHDLVFFLSPGHHSTTNGTAALMSFDADLPQHNLVLLNLEHIGQAGVYRSYMKSTTDRYGRRSATYVPTNWDSPGREVTLSPDSVAIRAAWNLAAQRNAFTTPALINGPAIAEPAPFVAAGGTGIQNVETGPWFHTTGDTVAAISPEGMQRAALFYRDFIDNVDRLTRQKVRAITDGSATSMH
jgi:Peptidase family M28